jgi:hypothetical protein
MRTLPEDQCKFLVVSRMILLRMKNISDRSCREKICILLSVTFFSFENPAVLEITGKYCSDEEATDDSMAHARCMLDT